MTTTVALAGSTGSIGTQALDVVAVEPDRFEVVALGASGRNLDQLVAQVEAVRPRVVAVTDEAAARTLADRLRGLILTSAGVASTGDLVRICHPCDPLNAFLTILSSIEWNEITTAIPPGFRI